MGTLRPRRSGSPAVFFMHLRLKTLHFYLDSAPDNDYTDDTVCTFACAEALLHRKDMAKTLWSRGREDLFRGFGGRFAYWLISSVVKPAYNSFGNGSAMRCSAAGFYGEE